MSTPNLIVYKNPLNLTVGQHNHQSAGQGGDYPWADFVSADVTYLQALVADITVTNLVDKSAAETITGNWTIDRGSYFTIGDSALSTDTDIRVYAHSGFNRTHIEWRDQVTAKFTLTHVNAATALILSGDSSSNSFDVQLYLTAYDLAVVSDGANSSIRAGSLATSYYNIRLYSEAAASANVRYYIGSTEQARIGLLVGSSTEFLIKKIATVTTLRLDDWTTVICEGDLQLAQGKKLQTDTTTTGVRTVQVLSNGATSAQILFASGTTTQVNAQITSAASTVFEVSASGGSITTLTLTSFTTLLASSLTALTSAATLTVSGLTTLVANGLTALTTAATLTVSGMTSLVSASITTVTLSSATTNIKIGNSAGGQTYVNLLIADGDNSGYFDCYAAGAKIGSVAWGGVGDTIVGMQIIGPTTDEYIALTSSGVSLIGDSVFLTVDAANSVQITIGANTTYIQDGNTSTACVITSASAGNFPEMGDGTNYWEIRNDQSDVDDIEFYLDGDLKWRLDYSAGTLVKV